MWEKSTTASFDVDAQKGFTPLCPDELPVPGGHLIVDALNKQATFARIRVGSKDWHPEDAFWVADDKHPQLTPIYGYSDLDYYWNKHCISGTRGAELLDGLPTPSEYAFMAYKGLEMNCHPYGACYRDLREQRSTGVIEFLKEEKIKTVILGGLALDYCVKVTAEQLAPYFKVYINLSACRALNKSVDEVVSLLKSDNINFVELETM